MISLRTSHRLLITIFITQSLFSASQISILTLHSIAAGILGGGDSTAGMPTTIVTFSQSLIAYAFGIYMGRFGRRMGLSTAYAFGAIGGVLRHTGRAAWPFPAAAGQRRLHGFRASRFSIKSICGRRDVSGGKTRADDRARGFCRHHRRHIRALVDRTRHTIGWLAVTGSGNRVAFGGFWILTRGSCRAASSCSN